ncbi:hypothetical protein Ga0609869_003568 [Rhodovulum iodosum]|uniref:VPLPA-CTERM sorting domain-containing protein n=1 Tax=Rhodovulum iodosum TaxID=68291 RepID=A0ABV3XXY6_9RHOB|nr:VPLPA-CTERM sorting domain-containing protein [Rhodovulum robiginosum]RSK38187.1 hypothetical protein EJA01_02585 [Rhodovulum robiginosum]
MFSKFHVLAASAALALSAGGAQALTVTTLDGDECAGTNFQACEVGGSPTIIKFTAGLEVDEINDMFASSVTGGEFTFDITETNDDDEILSMVWSYTPGPGDPAVTAVAVKAGSLYNLYTDLTLAEGLGFEVTVPATQALSHITFFDTDGVNGEIPLPAGLPLILSGLGALGLTRLIKRKSA